MTIQTLLIARAHVNIHCSAPEVWSALTNPDLIKKYMFGARVITDWKEGSPIMWKGVWKGKPYEDLGMILKIERNRLLQYTHFSPLAGKPDLPENYHTVTIELEEDGDTTHVSLTQDNNQTDKARIDSEKNWNVMLDTLKMMLEGTP